jgi:hypothetical protein
MRTRTAPWDYNRNTPAIDGEELAEMNKRKDQLAQAKASLTEIIGQRAYNQFESALPVWVRTNFQELTTEIEHELDRYECNCRPDGNACRGCVNTRTAKENR